MTRGSPELEGKVTTSRIWGEIIQKKGKEIKEVSNLRDTDDNKLDKTNIISNAVIPATSKGFIVNSNVLYELDENDSMSVQLDERKRRRFEIEEVGHLESGLDHQNIGLQTKENTKGVVTSVGDLTAPNDTVMAELALQASRPQ